MGVRVEEALSDVPPRQLPERVVAVAAELAGVPVGLYVVDLSGKVAARLAGPAGLPEQVAFSGAIGTELTRPALESLRAAAADSLPGGIVVPLWHREKATAVLLCAGEPQESLEALAHEASQALELAAGYTDVIDRARRLVPTSAAAELQQNLLAPRVVDLGDVELVGSLLPAYDVGGDWFDHADDPECVWLAVADAVGKGARAAAVSALGLASLRAARRAGRDLEGSCELVHDVLRELSEEAWMTACFASWQRETRTFAWIACGHPAPVLIEPDGELSELAGPTTYPLGILEDDRAFVRTERRLEPGQRILLYSDGITERQLPDGSRFGLEGVRDAVRAARDESAAGIVASIERHVLAATQDDVQDDATQLVFAPRL